MLALLTAIAFAWGPPPGPILPSPTRPRRAWRTFVSAPRYIGLRTVVTLQGILLYAGTLILLDPMDGRVRWRIPVKGDFVGLSGGDTITLTLGDVALRIDPVTGRTLSRIARRFPEARPGEPYVFPSARSFAWQGGRVYQYGNGAPDVDREDGPVGLAFVDRSQKDDWGGRYLVNVVQAFGHITMGDIDSGEGDDRSDRTYIARAVCADAKGVWAVRQGFGRAGRLVHILPVGFEEAGPSVNPTEGLPAWTPEGIVYARGRSLYRFDGRVSYRLLTYAHPSVDGADLRSARLTPWGIVRTAQGKRSVLVRLDPLPG